MTNKIAYILNFSLLLLVVSHNVEARILDKLRANYKFLTPVNNHKLSHPVTYDIQQDNDGNLWIATADGLNKFNGIDNKIYRPNAGDKNSLKHFTLRALHLDSSDRLWVGTDEGLNYYDNFQDDFKSLRPSNIHAITLSNALILTIFEDSSQRLWIETSENGLFIISKDRSHVVKIKLNTKVKTNLLRIREIQEVKPDQFLLATKQGVLGIQVENNTLSNQLTMSLETNVIFSENTHQLTILPNKDLLIGTTKGIYILNSTFEQQRLISSKLLSGRTFNNFIQLDDEKVLLGSYRSGLFLLDLNTNNPQQFTKSASNKYSLVDNQILSISRTRDNLIWIGTNLGINILNEKQNMFEHFRSQSSDDDCMSSNTVYTSLIDSTDKLWIGAFGSKLNIIDLVNNSCKSISSIPGVEDTQLLKYVVSLYEDENHDLWIGTFRKGIIRYRSKTKKFEKFDLAAYSNQKTNLSFITKITGNKKGKVWITSYYNGFYEFDINKEEISNFYPVSGEFTGETVKAIKDVISDQSQNLWIATDKYGLWHFDRISNAFTHYSSDKTIPNYIPKSLESLYFDSKGNLWISSSGEGVYKLSPRSKQIKRYNTDNGLLSNSTLSTIEDPNGNYWIFTDKGLSKLAPNKKSIVTYLEKDGLQSDSFTGAAFYDKKRELIWTGGINGINRFNPLKIEGEREPNKVHINSLDIFYKPVQLKKDWKDSPLNNVVSESHELFLKHDQNVFGLSFSSADFLEPEKFKYSFILEGYDSNWNEVSADRRYANYTNIEPGQYTFKVKAANKEGIWNNNITALKLNIAKPWWQTNLAYIVYIILSALTIYLIVTYRTKTLIKRSKELEQRVEQRTFELSQEKQKVEQLLSRKNEEFANVSHEFRTPLTLILGPIAQLLRIKRDNSELDKLNIVQRNGYRLLRMVDQLLNMETFRVKAITQKAPQAIGKTIQMIAEAFKDLADEKHVTLNIHTIEEINFEFTPDAIDKIMLNLLSNALKYTQSGGRIDINGCRTDKNCYQILVEDTGIGIPADKLNTVFERFNRVLDEKSEQVTGAGIGLALVKSLVESHKGKIELTSEVGKRTKVIVTLPIINEVSDFELTPHTNDEIIAMEMMSLVNQASSEGADSVTDVAVEDSNKPTILIIEDNEDMRNYIGNSIADNYKILMAQDGQQGFELAKQEVPDLIVSDIMMPKMDGYQTTRELRRNEITSHIPVILLTARGDRESRLKGWYEKADEYLTKPFDVEELKIRLNNLLEIRDILKKRFSESLFQPIDKIEEEHLEDLDQNKNKQQQIFIDRVNTTLEKLYSEPTTTMDDIADTLAMSKRQLFRKINSIMDMTPADYLRRFRLEKAKQILHEGRSAGFAALDAGFSSQSYFGKCFKAQYGKTPGEYQKSL